MTTQIDDQFTNLLASAFTADELKTMPKAQREWMRDMFFSGFVTAMEGVVMDPRGELLAYQQEIGTQTAETKARHCVTEAYMIKAMGN